MTTQHTATTWQQRLSAYYYLCRFDKPIGTELVLYPTLWALLLASDGLPDIKTTLIMTLGAIFMRAAGCAINDFADRKVDGHVARTKQRPLAAGMIQAKEALWVCLAFILASASLLLFLPMNVFYWSFGAVALAIIYPFMKRYTHLPQVFLGAAFSWSIPMAFAAVGKTPDVLCWCLYFANLAWTVAYDTQYAMTDRADDVKIGVKSTAILFGRYDLAMIAVLQAIFVGLLIFALYLKAWHWAWLVALAVLLIMDFIYQYLKTKQREPQWTFWAFRHNRWVGLLVLVVMGLQSLVS
ncbi:MAG: 4-hydroxybenzoate octaprenyltransferase [Acinetobacter sp.]|nr:4-hydroxybenzoate octaprenyltransferase [Acinetobacter sp.]